MEQEVYHEKERILTEEQASQILIVGGSTFPEHADVAARSINTVPGEVKFKQFPDGEQHLEYLESVRGKQVFIIQSDYEVPSNVPGVEEGRLWTIDNSIQQTALMIDAAERASAKEIVVIKPYMAYARQDRKAIGREPISSAAHIHQYLAMGMKHIVTIDIHAPQLQAIHKHFDNLSATGRLANEVQSYIESNDMDFDNVIFVSPDGGSLKLPTFFAKKLGGHADVMAKTRHKDGTVDHQDRIEGFGGRDCVLVDDMIATGGTLDSAIKVLRKSGVEKIIVAATHGLFSGPALDRLSAAELDQIIVTDSVPQKRNLEALGEDKLTVTEISTLIGKAIYELATDGSVSSIFESGKAFIR